MRIEMKLPDLSTADVTVKVVRWLVEAGQAVKQGQPLLEVETDKAVMEVEAYVSGVVTSIVAPPDTDVEGGQVIAILETGDAAVPPVPGRPVPVEPPRTPAVVSAAAAPKVARGASRTGGLFARNRQRRGHAASATASPIVLSTTQRIVGQRMLASKQTVPHFYLQTSVNAEPMIARRRAARGEKPAWDAFFAQAAGLALRQFERMGTRFSDGKLLRPETDAVGVAVDVAGDLYVIPVTEPASKSAERISAEIRAMVKRLEAGDPDARKLRPAALTISNLGASGVESFIAIVNPPEAAILAIGRVAPAVVVREGAMVIQNRVALTLSVDHRVASGRYAADFLSAIVKTLEALDPNAD